MLMTWVCLTRCMLLSIIAEQMQAQMAQKLEIRRAASGQMRSTVMPTLVLLIQTSF
jgi:hypothetical protein